MKLYLSVIILLLLSGRSNAQNLLVNGNAESGDPATNGWTVISIATTGAGCYNASGWRIIQNLNGFPAAENGSYFFYPGCAPSGSVGTATYELDQDVNVTLNAEVIDNGWDYFTFTGYMQVYNQSPADQSEIIVEYRNATKTTVLGTAYSSGFQSNINAWKLYTFTTQAPVGTRYVRVRLLAKSVNGTSVDGYFDNLTLTTSIPLPVVLSSFEVQSGPEAVQISWATSAQFSISHFTVQRSRDGLSWQDLQEVTPAESTANSGQHYAATDAHPLEGRSYYRLRITDLDGKTTFSEIKQTSHSPGFSEVELFPNPARNYVTIRSEGLSSMQVRLLNSLGQSLSIPASQQGNTLTLNTGALPRGLYLIVLNNGRATMIKKLSIQ